MNEPASPKYRRIGRSVALAVIGDDSLRRYVAEVLYSFRPGFSVSTARDAEHAAEWLRRDAPELVVVSEEYLSALGQVLARADLPRSKVLVLCGSSACRKSELARLPPAHVVLPERPELGTLLDAVRVHARGAA